MKEFSNLGDTNLSEEGWVAEEENWDSLAHSLEASVEIQQVVSRFQGSYCWVEGELCMAVSQGIRASEVQELK